MRELLPNNFKRKTHSTGIMFDVDRFVGNDESIRHHEILKFYRFQLLSNFGVIASVLPLRSLDWSVVPEL